MNKNLIGLSILLLTLLSIGSCIQLQIKQLHSDNFNHIVKENPYVLIEFYQPNNPLSKQMESQFIIAAQHLSGIDVVIAKINYQQNKQFVDYIGIKQIPAVFLFQGEDRNTYLNQVQGKQLAKWVKSYLSSRISEITTEDVRSLTGDYIIVQGVSQNELNIINGVSFFVPDFKFYYLKLKDNKNKQSLTLHQKNGKIHQYKGKFISKQIKKWIKTVAITSITPLVDQDSINHIMLSQTKPSFILVLSKKDVKNTQKYQLIQKICQLQKQRINCGKILQSYTIYKGAHDFFRDQSQRSLVTIVKDHMRIAYVHPNKYSKLSEKQLLQFIQNAINDDIPRAVDDSIPNSIEYKQVQIVDDTTIKEYLRNTQIALIQFYLSGDQGSLFFAPRYETFAKIIKQSEELKNVGIAAIDCKIYKQFCDEKIVKYYPTIRLYVQGISIQYPKSTNLPQIPELESFITNRINRKPITITLQNQSEVKKPALVLFGPKILDQLPIFSIKFDSISTYFISTDKQQYSLQLWVDDQVFTYQGKFQPNKINSWIKSKTGPLLDDLMQEVPSSKIISAISQKKPILFLLDYEKQKSQQIRIKFGIACKKLGLACAYAEATHPGFNSLLQWIKIKKQNIKNSMIVYSETVSDQKFLYQNSVTEVCKQSLEEFIENVKQGRIIETGSTTSSNINEDQKKKYDDEEISITDL